MKRSIKPSSAGLYAWLFLGFAGVMALFSASTVVTERVDADVDDKLFARFRDAVPRMQAMMAARDGVRDTEEALFEVLLTPASALGVLDTRPVTEARDRADSAVTALLSVPLIANQAALCERARADVHALDDAVTTFVGLLTEGEHVVDQRAALAEVHDAAQRVNADLRGFSTANATAAQVLAREESASRVAMMRLTYSLDAIAALVAAIIAMVIGARLNRHIRLEGEHDRLLETRAAELEGFAGRVAHDLLSPLTTVGLALGAARKALGQERSQLLTCGERGLKRVQVLVDGLLDFARSGAVPDPHRSCWVPKVLTELVEDARARAPGFSIELEPVPDCAVRCAPGVLSSIVSNLVGNAVKYTAGRPIEQVRVRATRTTARIVIEVEDTGPGIAPGDEEIIFLPHVRGVSGSVKPGIGLGLATVRRLVEAHGGRVGVRRLGEGLAVWCELPCAVDAPIEAPSVRNVLSS